MAKRFEELEFRRSNERRIISSETHELFNGKCMALSVKISNLITYLRSSEMKGVKYRKIEQD